MIGNDIVDLKDGDAQGKCKNLRFLAKVCRKEELHLIAGSNDPHEMLWTLWAIKEASYKAMEGWLHGQRSGQKEKLSFWPPHFHCFPADEGEGALWHCRYRHLCCHVFVEKNANYVHAIALVVVPPHQINPEELERLVSGVEEVAVDAKLGADPFYVSMRTRDLALRLARDAGIDADSIAGRPPQLYCKEAAIKEARVSLSHDGNYVAVALWRC